MSEDMRDKEIRELVFSTVFGLILIVIFCYVWNKEHKKNMVLSQILQRMSTVSVSTNDAPVFSQINSTYSASHSSDAFPNKFLSLDGLAGRKKE